MASWNRKALVNSLLLRPPLFPCTLRERGGMAAVKARTPSALRSSRKKGDLAIRIPGARSYANGWSKRR